MLVPVVDGARRRRRPAPDEADAELVVREGRASPACASGACMTNPVPTCADAPADTAGPPAPKRPNQPNGDFGPSCCWRFRHSPPCVTPPVADERLEPVDTGAEAEEVIQREPIPEIADHVFQVKSVQGEVAAMLFPAESPSIAYHSCRGCHWTFNPKTVIGQRHHHRVDERRVLNWPRAALA